MSRPQTIQEEKYNVITHGLMAMLLIAAMPFAVLYAFAGGGVVALRDAIGVAIFCLSLILMFGTSALYHGMPAGSRYKRIFNRFDHMSIFFAIAGSYTPIVLSIIGGKTGTIILIVEWSLVLVGILYKAFAFKKNRLSWIISITLYLAMGWAIAACFPLLGARATPASFWLIFTGGLFYTVGIFFFAQSRRYMHVVWHFFVNAGAICHFMAIVFFLRP